MYNGIGLQTARGSGTNGYVQRNLSLVKQIKKPVEYKSEDDFARLERELNRAPNQEILEHQNKRQIELKCLEMREQMEQQGYDMTSYPTHNRLSIRTFRTNPKMNLWFSFSEDKIEAKIKEYREELKARMEKKVRNKAEWLLENFPQK